MRKKVIFFNGRISVRGAGRLPNIHTSIRTPIGPVELGKLQLCDENGNPKTVFNGDKEVPVYWEGTTGSDPRRPGIVFGQDQMKFELDPMIHKNVIDAIREWPGCKSSRKSDDAKELATKRPMTHYLIEYEPDVAEAEALKAMDLELESTRLLSIARTAIRKGTLAGHLISAMCGKAEKGTISGKLLHVKRHSEENRESFIELFDGDVLDPKLFNVALIKLAMGIGVISVKGGSYWFGEQDLGSNSGEITSKYPNALAPIKNAVEEMLGVKPDESEENTKE